MIRVPTLISGFTVIEPWHNALSVHAVNTPECLAHERRRQTPSEAFRGAVSIVDVAREKLWWEHVTLAAPRQAKYRSLGAVPSASAFREIPAPKTQQKGLT